MKKAGKGIGVMMALVLGGCAVPDGGAKKGGPVPALQGELERTKAEVAKAARAGGEWRDTGQLIKDAEAAIGKGDIEKAKQLLSAAQEEAQMGYEQAQSQQDVVREMSKADRVASAQVIAEGKEISFDRKKGNCLSCHAMDDGVSPGTIGPPLSSIQQRFPNKGALYGQIWDATVRNPQTLMPPFGRHKILSKAEIEKIVEYVWTL